MFRRTPIAIAIVTILAGTVSPAVAAGRWTKVACGLPVEWLRRTDNGYRADRSGEIMIVPALGNYFDNHSHAGPWPYLQEIPMFLYGPGHVSEAGRLLRPVQMPDLAPTLAEHMAFTFNARHGESMGAVEPGATAPKVILVVVWDGGGRNVLARYRKAWPNVRQRIPDGAWFERATVGTSPSTTPAVHSTLGTGSFPTSHGIVDLSFRVGDALRSIRNSVAYLDDNTIGDEYDVQNGNTPVVGFVGNALAIGMGSHGSARQGGDEDLALVHDSTGRWGLPGSLQPYFRFPSWVRDVPGPDPSRGLDETPRFARYETRLVAELIRREGFGDDALTDLLFVNYKQIDKIGHRYSMYSPKMREVVRSSDGAVGRLVEVLDAEVGEGEWVLALTADHGSTPPARATGGFRISRQALVDDLRRKFDRDRDGRSIVDDMATAEIFIDVTELRRNGFGLPAVSRFLMAYRERQNDPGAGRERVFRAAFPGSVLRGTPPCLG
jgi:hypothetical protein